MLNTSETTVSMQVDTRAKRNKVASSAEPCSELEIESCRPLGTDKLDQILRVLGEVREILVTQHERAYYSVAQAAAYLSKAPFTVREWCRQGRIHARKKSNGRGLSRDWVIAHAELLRVQRDGLLAASRS